MGKLRRWLVLVVASALLTAVSGSASATATSYVAFGDLQPSWSPDGRRIAFWTTGRGASWDRPAIYVMNADGSGIAELGEGDASEPAWSPDGRRIAFASVRGGQVPCTGGVCGPISCCRNPTAINVMNADGSEPRAVATKPGYNRKPSWSPDGEQIVFSSNDNGIYVIDADGSGLRRVATGRDPAWSPDGTRIAFVRDNGVYVSTIDGTERKVVDARASTPAWSPDGRKLAFSADAAIHTINADGAGRTWITAGQNPAWSPDGRKIAFDLIEFISSTGVPGVLNIYVVNADGSGRVRLTSSSHVQTTPPRPPAARLASWPAVPKAGRVFTATLHLEPRLSRPLHLRCTARLADQQLPPLGQRLTERSAACSWRLARRARGARLTGSLEVLVDGFRVQRTFAFRVR